MLARQQAAHPGRLAHDRMALAGAHPFMISARGLKLGAAAPAPAPLVLRRRLLGQSGAASVSVEAPPTTSTSSRFAPPQPDAATTAQPAAAADAAGDAFDWHKQWYPVAAIECLKPDRPHALQLLGVRLVAFKDAAGEWAVLEDVCPHRLAPLSDGRLTAGRELMCSYHGWTFDAKGACTSIPQIADAKAHATACASGRSCVRRFPTQELHGLLWVFADATPAGAARAAAAPPATALAAMGVGEGAGYTHELKQSWFQRDTPVGLDLLLENFTDPSHVPFSHHGVIGSRDNDNRMEIELIDGGGVEGVAGNGYGAGAGTSGSDSDGEGSGGSRAASPGGGGGGVSRDGGFVIKVTNAFQSYTIDFTPPCRVRHNITKDMSLILYGVPTAPGWSRVFVSFAGRKTLRQRMPNAPGMPAAIRTMVNAISAVPALFHAFTQNAIIDGDHAFVNQAERTFWQRGGRNSWRKQYYMPSSADAGVIAWRRWLDRHGLNLPTLPASAADLPQVERAVVFDRLNQHTKHCPHCSRALALINAALVALAATATGALGVAVVALAYGGAAPALQRLVGACAAVVGGAVLAALPLLRLRPKFIGEEYVHATK